ncbi:MAG: outer membrane beta-barrel protein [Bacteroidota bacterium]
MKRLIINIILLLLTINTYSQIFFDGGLKGMFGTTWLINENIFKDPDYNHQISPGYFVGGKLGLNFNESVEVVSEVLYSTFKQSFTIDDYGDKVIKINSIDIPLMIRHNKSSGSYFEIGPQLSLLQKVDETGFNQDNDASTYFDDKYLSGVISFGGYMIGWDNFGISVGFRLVFSMVDIVSGGVADPETYKDKVASYDSYKPTYPLSAGLVIEFNYDLGYLAKTPCGGRRKFLIFK